MSKCMRLPLLFVMMACSTPTESPSFTFGDEVTGSSESTGDATTAESTTTTTPTSTTDVDETTGTTGSSSSGGESSSSGSGPVCGNGVVEQGEQCDDGDDDEFDDCTSECRVPRCDDQAHNGDETDVDCGGSCQGCALCSACQDSNDCAGSLVCGDAGACIVHAEMVVDWVDNCGGVVDGAVVEDLPAGTYLATAVMSAGTLWLPPHNPPSTGYFYEIECNAGVHLDELATPPGVRYQTIAEAFNNINATVQQFDFIGGDLVCYRSDGTCGDNNGRVEFDLDYVCPK